MSLYMLTATLFALAQKVQNVHWSITGPSFLEIHTLLGDQYQKLREFGDVFAENMRQLQIEDLPTLRDIAAVDIPPFELGTWQSMLKDLIMDFHRLKEQVNAFETNQRGIANDLDELHKYLSKQLWFLRSYFE